MMELTQATEEKIVKLPKEIAEEYAKAESVMELSDEKAKEERDMKKLEGCCDGCCGWIFSRHDSCNR